MNFHNVRFPEFLSLQAEGGPCFNTIIAAHASGREKRKARHNIPRRKYVIKNCSIDDNQYLHLLDFFQARKGKFHSFRYRDYFSYKIVNHDFTGYPITEDKFLITLPNYDPYTEAPMRVPYVISDSIEVKANDQLVRDGYELNAEQAEITISDPALMAMQLTISLEYDIVMRFNNDEIVTKIDDNGKIIIEHLELVELLDE